MLSVQGVSSSSIIIGISIQIEAKLRIENLKLRIHAEIYKKKTTIGKIGFNFLPLYMKKYIKIKTSYSHFFSSTKWLHHILNPFLILGLIIMVFFLIRTVFLRGFDLSSTKTCHTCFENNLNNCLVIRFRTKTMC